MLAIVAVRAFVLVDADAPSSTVKSARAIVFESMVVSPAVRDVCQQLRCGPVYGYTHAASRLRGPGPAMDARRLWQPLRIGISLVARGVVQWDGR